MHIINKQLKEIVIRKSHKCLILLEKVNGVHGINLRV